MWNDIQYNTHRIFRKEKYRWQCIIVIDNHVKKNMDGGVSNHKIRCFCLFGVVLACFPENTRLLFSEIHDKRVDHLLVFLWAMISADGQVSNKRFLIRAMWSDHKTFFFSGTYWAGHYYQIRFCWKHFHYLLTEGALPAESWP